MKHFPLIACPP